MASISLSPKTFIIPNILHINAKRLQNTSDRTYSVDFTKKCPYSQLARIADMV